MESRSGELVERIRALSDDELLKMVEEESDQYRPEALDVARDEIESRGLAQFESDVEGVRPEASDDVAVEDVGTPAPQQGLLCPACGSALRPALLFGDSQMVAVFEDNREQRFVRALVCPRCGSADLFVDFKNEVED